MKKVFNKPEIEFVKFNVSDVIMASVDPMDGYNQAYTETGDYGNVQSGIGNLVGGDDFGKGLQ